MLKLPFSNNMVHFEATYKQILKQSSIGKSKAPLTYSNSKDDFVKRKKKRKELWVQGGSFPQLH